MPSDAATTKQRDYFFDNAKFVLIVLVVFSHAITPLIAWHQFSRGLYLLLFSFHMPLFLFISGYFAKKAVAQKQWIKPLQKLLVPYIIFQVIYSFFYFDVENQSFHIPIFEPHWSLWFLLTLFSYYLIIHLFKFSPYMIIAAIVLGVLIGYGDPFSWFSLSRTIVFLPFFLAGYFLKREHFTFLFHARMKILGAAILIGIFAIFYVYAYDIPYELFYGNTSYNEMGVNNVMGTIYRLLAYVVTFLVSIAFLTFIPQDKRTISQYAKNTLYVYLLHGFLFRYLRETEVYEGINTVFEVFLIACFCVAFSIFLSSAFVRKAAQPLIEPFTFFKNK
ncbi:Fucose 4-O-acetylase [Alteribacillus persepolensis]|uniref:Fucose 4-O-acetylase n=1 Tax=Alteribacillus persepolensis TaxID=568899 RepID=A0A1G8JII4_9BACI|nr:acyltransferase family protein [Alteribacillus persepolensis]SDI31015.1 Fucose 4-O-acetylase [Alteribacillus persepolensis]